MLGLLVLFILGLWLLLTLAAMVFGYKAGKWLTGRTWAGLLGMFAGFMLLMGGQVTHWVMEYREAKAYAASVCGLAGYKIYVPPEEWKKTVSEEEWKQMAEFKSWLVDPTEKNGPKTLVFEGEEYKISLQLNDRVTNYSRIDGRGYTRIFNDLFYDVTRREVLFKITDVYTGVGSSGLASLTDFKSWLNDIPDCPSSKQSSELLDIYFEPLERYREKH